MQKLKQSVHSKLVYLLNFPCLRCSTESSKVRVVMTDNVQVKMVILENQKELFESVIDYFDLVQPVAGNYECKSSLLEYTFNEVNEAFFEEQPKLQALNIPYSKYWDSSDQLKGGESHFRISKDKEVAFTYFEQGTRNRLDIKDVSMAAARGVLLDYIEVMEEKFYVMPWDEQFSVLAAGPIDEPMTT